MDWEAIGVGISFCPFYWKWGRLRDANYFSHGYMIAVGPFRLAIKF